MSSSTSPPLAEELKHISFPPNAYATLKLSPFETYTPSQIKSQYRKLALKLHPDSASARIPDSDPNKEAKVEALREEFEDMNEAYKLLMDAEEREKLDQMLQSHIEKQKKLMRMDAERREMRQKLEQREKKKRKRELDQNEWSRKLRLAKQIVENGGYDELDDIQLEYDREEKKKWLQQQRMREGGPAAADAQQQQQRVDTSKIVRVSWSLLHDKASPKISPSQLRDMLQTKFGSIERVVVKRKKSRTDASKKNLSALVYFTYRNSVSMALQWKPTQMIHPHYIFQFSRVSPEDIRHSGSRR